jgi:hypothetical protein
MRSWRSKDEWQPSFLRICLGIKATHPIAGLPEEGKFILFEKSDSNPQALQH